jgi:hypothetical protein
MTQEPNNATCNEVVLIKTEPIFDGSKKKRAIVSRVNYEWSNSGKSGVSPQIRIQVANYDGEDATKKKEIGIPLELVPAVVRAVAEQLKKFPPEGNEATSESLKG